MPKRLSMWALDGIILALLLGGHSQAMAAETFVIHAAPTETAPALDGTLNDPAWKSGVHVRLQWDFSFRREASEPTDAYLLSDKHFLYVAFAATQREPVTATQHTNDVSLAADDIVRIYLWPGGDRGFRYGFASNPIGTRFAESSENSAFAPTWLSVGRTTGTGYTVTERIPLEAMRGDGRSTWRIQFDRRIFSTTQYLEWAHDDAQTSTNDALYSGTLDGMRAAASAAKTKPRLNVYSLGELASGTIGGSTSRVGADLAIPITSTASFLATFHPDYSNVELDQQSIAPTAFARRFSEVRPFFTQGASFYNQQNCNDCINTPFLYTPNIPTPRDGYAVEGVQGPVNFGAFDAQSFQRTDAAQSILFRTADRKINVNYQRAAVDTPTLHDDAEYLQAIAGNPHNFNVYATSGEERGTMVTDPAQGSYKEYGLNLFTPKSGLFAAYHEVGAQYAPVDSFFQINDVRGPTVYVYRELDNAPSAFVQNVTVSQDYGRLTSLGGTLNDAYWASAVTINTKTLYSFTLTSGNQYLLLPGTPGGDANQNGISVGYGTNSLTPTSFSYSIGRFGAGYLRSTVRSTTLRLGAHGTLLLEADNTNQTLDGGPKNVQWLERAAIGYQLGRDSSVAAGVRRIIGTGFTFFGAQQPVNASNVSFAYHRRSGHGEAYLVYGDPNAVATTPALIFKYIFYAGAEKGT